MSGHADTMPRIHESMHFYEIVEQWDALVAENQRLREEIKRLQSQLGVLPEPVPEGYFDV